MPTARHSSFSQVHRLVSGTPERLSLPVLATLCDVLDCTPTDLIATSAQTPGPPRRRRRDVAQPGRSPSHTGPADTRGMSGDARGVRAVDDPRLSTSRAATTSRSRACSHRGRQIEYPSPRDLDDELRMQLDDVSR
ncbi:helix-turn-helix transcriptional regulator [Streptomyces sp. NPDC006984]|uniref:helix-turn-helix domain-containing protein n=1 Tax=Streptomyces sp. NPDC006984 TaxID=3155463 RepID=UPI0034108834